MRGGGGPVQWWGGGQSGCERRIEVIVKMQNEIKKKQVGVGSSLRGGVEELKLLRKCKKKSRRVRSWPELMDVPEELKIEVRIDVNEVLKLW